MDTIWSLSACKCVSPPINCELRKICPVTVQIFIRRSALAGWDGQKEFAPSDHAFLTASLSL